MGGFRIFKSRRKDKEKANGTHNGAAASRSKQAELREERNFWRAIAKNPRAFAAHRYIKGDGIEIGGLHRPLQVYNGARVRYVDRLSTEQIREFYRDVADQP